MAAPRKYPHELRERAIRLAMDAPKEPTTRPHLMKATPAHKAAYMGHADVTRLLVAHSRLDLDGQGPYNGYTALHDAAWHGHLEAARALVEAGARTDVRGHASRTAHDMAREYGHTAIVGLLSSPYPRPTEGRDR